MLHLLSLLPCRSSLTLSLAGLCNHLHLNCIATGLHSAGVSVQDPEEPRPKPSTLNLNPMPFCCTPHNVMVVTCLSFALYCHELMLSYTYRPWRGMELLPGQVFLLATWPCQQAPSPQPTPPLLPGRRSSLACVWEWAVPCCCCWPCAAACASARRRRSNSSSRLEPPPCQKPALKAQVGCLRMLLRHRMARAGRIRQKMVWHLIQAGGLQM